MKCIKLLAVFCVAVSLITAGGSPAAAQPFLDLYGGAVFPRLPDTEVKTSTGKEENSVDMKSSFVLGARAGYWGTEVGLDWFGMGVDVSYWQSKARDAVLGSKPEVKTLPVTVLLMFRYPGEKVQPYAGVGGGLFLSKMENDLDLSLLGGSGSGSFKDYQADVGFDARGGLAVTVNKKISLFAEGRYVYFSPHYKDKIDGEKVTVSSDVRAIQALAGISFRF